MLHSKIFLQKKNINYKVGENVRNKYKNKNNNKINQIIIYNN